MTRHIVAAGLAGLIIAVAASPSSGGPRRPAASSPAAPRSQDVKPLQYDVNVILKLVQVHVTDKKGSPVRDLVREDFAVTDSGRPVEITAFEKHVLAAPAAAAPAATEAGPAPAAIRPTGRKFFLFFDFAYNNARGIEKAQKAALHFIDAIAGPLDEVAVVSYAAIGGLAFHEYLTRDHAQVRKVLQGLGHQNVRGRATDIEDTYWRMTQASGGPAALNILSAAEMDRQESRSMAQKYMLTLADLARALRLVEGEKNFILFSSGVPNSLIYGYASSNVANRSDVARASGDRVLREQNEAMYKEFGAAGCAFYAFDTRTSAKETALFAYDEFSFAMGSRALTTAVEPFGIFRDDRATGLDSLKRLTDTTGGKYYSNIDLYAKNLGQVQEATGSYYVLGYPVQEKRDGLFHEVKVEVRRKDCLVRTQAGYFNPKPFAEFTDIEKRIHLFDLAINERSFSRLPGSVPTTALSYAVGGEPRLAVLARVPREITAQLAGPKIEVVGISFDDDGDVADIAREEIDTASLAGRDAVLAAGAALKPGAYAGRLILRDLTTGQSAVGSVRAAISPPAAGGLRLGTPLLLAAGPAVPLREAAGRKGGTARVFGDGYPYDASFFAPVLGPAPASAARLAAVIPCATPDGGEADLVLTVRLVDAVSGAAVPVETSLIGRVLDGPLEVLTLALPIAAVPPATYYLHAYAKDKRTGALGHAVTTLTVPAR